MKYCPECKTNYEIKQDFCPNCSTLLIAHLSENPGATHPDDSWVIIGGVKNELNYEVAKGSLDSNNIPSVFLSSDEKYKLEISSSFNNQEDENNIIMVPREYKYEALMLLADILGDNLKIINSNNGLI